MTFRNETYDAWLASAELPYEWLIPLLHRTGSARQVYTALVEDKQLMRDQIPDGCREKLLTLSGTEALGRMQSVMEEYNISSLTILEEAYPHCLRQIPDPPGILFTQGSTGCLNHPRKAAMIGSRSASYAGLKAARKTAAELSAGGVCIISGLAYGIDTESHSGCLEGGSPTIAVMGGGLDQNYPARNLPLKKEILQHGGLLLSEYAPGVRPVGHHFPYRNRIISGLSDVTILMEAKIRSGSMTTIGHALKQGKEVYAYPGDPVSPLCEGNRLLLREGARYFTQAREILEDMDWLDNNAHVGQNIVCSAERLPENDTEKVVLRALEKGNLGFDELVQMTGLPSADLLSTLTIMQIRKLIDPLPGKRYQIRQ